MQTWGDVAKAFEGMGSVAIVGSRTWPHPQMVRFLVRVLPASVTVISGGARGVDETAEACARDRGLKVKSIRPDWTKHGKGAGIVRNRQIVEHAEMVVAFWDGQSRGTKNTIDTAIELKRPLMVFQPPDKEPVGIDGLT